MAISSNPWRTALRPGPLLLALLVSGCAGFEPYEPRDEREEGPERGLVSGEAGEFVIFTRPDEREAGSEANQR